MVHGHADFIYIRSDPYRRVLWNEPFGTGGGQSYLAPIGRNTDCSLGVLRPVERAKEVSLSHEPLYAHVIESSRALLPRLGIVPFLLRVEHNAQLHAQFRTPRGVDAAAFRRCYEII